MKLELNEEASWTISIVVIAILAAVFFVTVFGYYRLKSTQLTEMVKAGANPVIVRCALYQTCPVTGKISVESQR